MLVEEKVARTFDRPSLDPEGFQPVGDGLLVFVDKYESETPGGILLPDSVTKGQAPARGWVVTAGPDVKEVKGGDYVSFMLFAGAFLEDTNPYESLKSEETWKVLNESDIFGFWREAK